MHLRYAANAFDLGLHPWSSAAKISVYLTLSGAAKGRLVVPIHGRCTRLDCDKAFRQFHGLVNIR